MDVLACKRRHKANKLDAMDVDDTLVLIVERIDSLISLIRAASTCRRWRRLIADAGFLRRYHSLRGPPIAGHYYNRYRRRDATGNPLFVPSSSIDAGHFSLDFVVDGSIFDSQGWMNIAWQVRDSCGSLLLMQCMHDSFIYRAFTDLVVCEPMTRCYKIIPRPPGFNIGFTFQGTYLLDGVEDGAGRRIGRSNFKVQCVLLNSEHMVAHTAVFTVRDTNSTWSRKEVDHIASRIANVNVTLCYLGRGVLGSSYYYVRQDGMLITRDGSTGTFSSLVLSHDIKRYCDAHFFRQTMPVVDGGDGESRIVTRMDNTLEVFASVDGEWRLVNKLVLYKGTRGLPGYRTSFFDKPLAILRGGEGFIIVISTWEPKPQWPFSVDLRTMEVAPATLVGGGRLLYPCEFLWPPVLQVCLDK